MHRAKQVLQCMRSVANKLWQWTRLFRVKLGTLVMKSFNLLKEAKSGESHDPIPPLGIVIGALAFGMWWQSFAAALFGAIALFFLAGIYKTSERMLVTLRQSGKEPRQVDLDAGTFPEPAPENSEAVSEAIACLKPWLANEVALTEQSAKECCGVLVDTVAAKARRLTTQF